MSSTFQPFKEEHKIFRQQVRSFVENELAPKVDQWEEEKLFPNSVFKRAGELGILGAHYPEDVVLHAVEPDPAMRRHLVRHFRTVDRVDEKVAPVVGLGDLSVHGPGVTRASDGIGDRARGERVCREAGGQRRAPPCRDCAQERVGPRVGPRVGQQRFGAAVLLGDQQSER